MTDEKRPVNRYRELLEGATNITPEKRAEYEARLAQMEDRERRVAALGGGSTGVVASLGNKTIQAGFSSDGSLQVSGGITLDTKFVPEDDEVNNKLAIKTGLKAVESRKAACTHAGLGECSVSLTTEDGRVVMSCNNQQLPDCLGIESCAEFLTVTVNRILDLR